MVVKKVSYFKDIIIAILVIILALALVYNIGFLNKPTIIYLTNQTNIIDQTTIISNQTTVTQNNSFTVPLNPEKEYYSYDINLVVSPAKLCAGEDVTGKITSNIPKGICSIFADTGTGFKVYKNIVLNVNGYYSETNQMNTVGKIIFRAVCCDINKNCKISSDTQLTIEQCPPDNDGDGIPDETDPDDDNDGYPDEREIEEGTDPKDPLSHPEEIEWTCDSICKDAGYASGRGPVDSPGRCNPPEVYGEQCCCMPTSQPATNYFCCRDSAAIMGCFPSGCGSGSVQLGQYSSLSNCQQNCIMYTQEEWLACSNFVSSSVPRRAWYDIMSTATTDCAYWASTMSAYKCSSPKIVTDTLTSGRCCIWNCEEPVVETSISSSEECSAWANSRGMQHWIYDSITMRYASDAKTTCYNYHAKLNCGDIPVSEWDFAMWNCCIWNCAGVV